MGPVTLIDALSRRPGPWGQFSSAYEALAFKARNRLGPAWAVFDPRPIEERDLLVEACDPIIDTLRPFWRARQFDRLANGIIDRLPDCDSSGLSRDTTMAVAQILSLAGVEGWEPVTGALMRRQGPDQFHSWLRHESGRVLDLSDPEAGALGLSITDPDLHALSRYVEDVVLPRGDDLDDPQGWAQRITPELIASIRDVLQLDAEPTPDAPCEF